MRTTTKSPQPGRVILGERNSHDPVVALRSRFLSPPTPSFRLPNFAFKLTLILACMANAHGNSPYPISSEPAARPLLRLHPSFASKGRTSYAESVLSEE